MFKKAMVGFSMGACLACAPSFAAPEGGDIAKPASGVYFGAGIGQSKLKLDIDGIGSGSKEAFSWKLFGGWRFNEYLSLEGSYADAGDYEESAGGSRLAIKPEYYSVSALGTWPLKENFAVFGRAGMAHWKSELRYSESNELLFSGSDDGDDLLLGAGIACYLDGAIVRLEYELINDVDSGIVVDGDTKADLSLISLQVAWKF